MIEVTTKSGFTCQVNKNALNDMALVDLMIEETGIEAFRTAKIVKLMLGDQKAKLYDHVRAEDGTVPIEKVTAEMEEIFLALHEQGKNS